jgi:hypothetical protein
MELDLKKLKVETENAQEQYEMLRQESLDLRDEFKAIYPASVCPVFLGLPEGASAPLTLKSPLKGEQPHF